MIDEIQVQNLALIKSASLAPCEGLTVITGETGAGKTALLSALKLLMGIRASADLVRDGENSLTVSGRFFGLHAANDNDEGSTSVPQMEFDDVVEDETVIVRQVTSDGRSRANVNGALASVKELAQIVAPSVDLCGQFEHQQLMKPSNHIRMLDVWAGDAVSSAREAYTQAFAAANSAAEQLELVRQASETSSAQIDEARFTLRRIDEVNPEEGEYEQLAHSLKISEHAESLARAAGTAHEALSGDNGALDALNAAAAALETGGRIDEELSALAQSLREAGYILEDVSAQARDYLDGVEFDPEELEYQQTRYSLFQGLLRSFGPRMEDVFTARENAARTISLADDSETHLRAAQQQLDEAERTLAQAADRLDVARAQVAPTFADEVSAIMARLQMGGAQLVCSSKRLERSAWTATSPSSFEFLYRPGSDMQARPLARIASGGEISRVMLAVKVVLGADDDVDTLVFDEVDAGVGGAVAVALADVIADLAQTHQVIVVTHLAQVAVRGQAHYVVRRSADQANPETLLAPVTNEARVDEIARMLSGSITEASRNHAKELLASFAS